MKALDILALVLLIVGGLNWLLVGLFEFDLVASIFGGQDEILSKVVYILVGLAALYCLKFFGMITDDGARREAHHDDVNRNHDPAADNATHRTADGTPGTRPTLENERNTRTDGTVNDKTVDDTTHRTVDDTPGARPTLENERNTRTDSVVNDDTVDDTTTRRKDDTDRL
ncbi:DUF378 domain-containing protein [Salinicoccus hispanicus]|uniref:DUF378 domain-containing protein n=1 Tax=Salinicoccus hispanicus TaxID=157225 RepID=A0A6N8U8T1_9STAP|nr:DUF378 domain-containing protein [Salinicoccus hispanicus]